MKILFIQTGGTIDKDYPRNKKGYAFEITEPAVERMLKRLNPAFDYEIVSLFRKDSLDLTVDDRTKIYETCLDAVGEKIIVTHGTDTMIETALFLSSIKNKLIVFTGAMKPEKFTDSDAPLNLGVALGAISLLKEGVFIAMNGRVYPVDEVARNPETGQFTGAEVEADKDGVRLSSFSKSDPELE